jgi:hypothetical protein
MSENNLFHFAQVVSEMSAQPHSTQALQHTEGRQVYRIRQVRDHELSVELQMTQPMPCLQHWLAWLVGNVQNTPMLYDHISNPLCYLVPL